jgi:hypothetical protein
MTRLLLAASVSALALAACSQAPESEAPVEGAAPAEVMAGEAVDAESLESILAIEDPSERREALIARGDALQAAMQARFENRIAPLREELDQVVAAIGAAETELASSAFAVAAPIIAEARACEGGNPDGPEFTPPQIRDALTPAATNEIVGAAFLSAADAAPCVYRLDSGLRFRVDVANAEGESPEGGETVLVHYEGTLPDGTVFDSSYERGEPAAFPSDRLIRGWVEALAHMNTGETWSLFIPAELAYGDQGAGGDIGPNAVLRFKVELLDLPMRAPAPSELEPVDADGEDGPE